jgi:hypothetical protein
MESAASGQLQSTAWSSEWDTRRQELPAATWVVAPASPGSWVRAVEDAKGPRRRSLIAHLQAARRQIRHLEQSSLRGLPQGETIKDPKEEHMTAAHLRLTLKR